MISTLDPAEACSCGFNNPIISTQYHMRTCSAHHQVTDSGHPLNGGLEGTVGVNYPGYLLVVIKCIYLPPTYLHFIQDIEDRSLLLTSSMSFVDIRF
jgi:hypothetical protein